tara:strand:+ start:1147 stop:1290 length:144 start_codon:yes stop_codon:yes gene_type:complete
MKKNAETRMVKLVFLTGKPSDLKALRKILIYVKQLSEHILSQNFDSL